jgi:hypothetical protein
MRMLVLLHLVANAVVLWLSYLWLGVAEADAKGLLWSAALALLVLVLSCWTYGAALRHFQLQERRVMAWRRVFPNVPPLLAAVLMVGAVYWVLARGAASSSDLAFQIASYITLKSRSPLAPETVQSIFDSALWLLRWIVIPVFYLPVLSAMAVRGWSGIRELFARRPWIYWLQAPVLILCALWVPLRLLTWIPQMETFATEMGSFVLRAGGAYLLFTVAGLALAFVTAAAMSAGRPRVTQPSTVVSP